MTPKIFYADDLQILRCHCAKQDLHGSVRPKRKARDEEQRTFATDIARALPDQDLDRNEFVYLEPSAAAWKSVR